MSILRRLKPEEATALGRQIVEQFGRGNAKYRISTEQWSKVCEMRGRGTIDGLEDMANDMNLDHANCKHVWIKTKDGTMYATNPDYVGPEEQELKEIDFFAVFKQIIEPFQHIETTNYCTGLFDRAVLTDVHIGMNANPTTYSLYGGKWDADELKARCLVFVSFIIERKRSNTLVVDELGDFLDGFNGKTTRNSAHDLPQNMSNQEAYDNAVQFKLILVEELAKYYTKIIFNNICNDNHSGAFGYFANSGFETYCDLRFKDSPVEVEVNNLQRFMNHYQIGKYIFILTHGKDEEFMKHGMKPSIDGRVTEFVSGYINENYLRQKDTVIELSKGDSHQLLLDDSSSDLFNYYNYPAFSPSSAWVQANFKKGKSGFIFFNYYEDPNLQPTLHKHLFKWIK